MSWRDGKCAECGCRDFDTSELFSRGVVYCIDCGLVAIDYVLDSSAAPPKEGEDNRAGGPIKRASIGVKNDPTPREGDILWNMPSGRKMVICHEKSGGCGNTQLIKKLDEECDGCGGSFWILKQNLDSPPVGKDEDWIFKRQASQFLRLQEAPGKTLEEKGRHLSEDIKDLRIGRHWTGLVVDAISNPGLPERAPVGEDGGRMWTPERERIGIEVYLLLTHQEHCFWFFDEFIHRMRLNRNRIERILEKALPISERYDQFLTEISNRDFGLNNSYVGFIPRCSDILGVKAPLPNTMPFWFENPSEDLWAKLALGIRNSESRFPLRYWIEVPEWEESGRIRGLVREYQSPLILRHIPTAYFIAQEIWCRRDDNAREICTRILEMISKDLVWCAATVEEMDAWWDEIWDKQDDQTPSVTKLRHS